jgi:hypothetical protein
VEGDPAQLGAIEHFVEALAQLQGIEHHYTATENHRGTTKACIAKLSLSSGAGFEPATFGL